MARASQHFFIETLFREGDETRSIIPIISQSSLLPPPRKEETAQGLHPFLPPNLLHLSERILPSKVLLHTLRQE